MEPAPSRARFRSFAGICALVIAAGNVAYAVSFLIVRPNNTDGLTASAALLAAGGILAVPVFVALYGILSEREPDFALLALLLGVVGAIGATAHGTFDIANKINPPESIDVNSIADLPSYVDPRGLLTFGITGLALGAVSAAILGGGGGGLPRGIGQIAGVLAVLLIFVFAMRLTVLNPDDAIVVAPAGLTGFVLSPIYYAWLGVTLRRLPAS